MQTVCPYCGVGCGVIAENTREGPQLKGDRDHPANYGLLCSKGMTLAETLGDDGRLLWPEYRGRRVDWDEALSKVASGLTDTIRDHGPDSVAFYVSGQLLTEDYYVANKLMKGFIGSANIDTNSRLCMSSSVSGHVRAFGEDVVPGCYEDLEQADLVIYAGSNAAWCHPILHRRVLERRVPPVRVVIDPRWTPTCEGALHLALKPGSDVALWNGLLVHLHDTGTVDEKFVAAHTEGYESALESARADAGSIEMTAQATGLEAEVVASFFDLFVRWDRVVTLYSQGVNQSSSGTDKVNAILNCHLATGRLGRPGMGPLSLTGQPNAMGGREVGGLANQLAAHRGFTAVDVDSVGRFWGASRMAQRPGLKAVELFDAVADGRIRAVWIMATNPVDSLPQADLVRQALSRCPLVIVSDCVAKNDTLSWAHIRLPALAWGEKSGMVTNSERCISRQRPFLQPPPGVRADWEIICAVAARMGFGADFNFSGPADIFREHAALSGFENNGLRLFDLSGVSSLSDLDYEQWIPRAWPIRVGEPERSRLFGDGLFPRSSGRSQIVPVTRRAPATMTSADYPLVLNTGRLRDQWHTTTRTGLSARLSRHQRIPEVCCHPGDAAAAGIQEGDMADITTSLGAARARVRVTSEVRPGTLFVSIHWTDQTATGGLIGAMVNPAVDPISGQPELKHTPARIELWPTDWRAVVLTRAELASPAPFWARTRERNCWHYEMAGSGQTPAREWLAAISPLLPGQEIVEYEDAATGSYRVARFTYDRLDLCAFWERAQWPQLLPDVAGYFQGPVDVRARRALLGALGTGSSRVLCACFQTTEQQIRDSARRHNLTTVDAVGDALAAGTRCRSCRPELAALLRQIEVTS